MPDKPPRCYLALTALIALTALTALALGLVPPSAASARARRPGSESRDQRCGAGYWPTR